ncbi:hypothetical protein PoB_005467700 [Plakobranchus ocellatus]|uniref:Uncharacterized protein n=1 Tax=Plakobranchus ocellatus TaxID=259542 RepID=A0AAV4CA73_9GAST|nr:hypothetical protein PoB_005467700 [Plakobranchus ocellatus]
MNICLLVVSRQLFDFFLDGGVFGGALDENLKAVLNTWSLTNLTGKRLFGDMDHDMVRRRRSSIHLRTTLSRAQQGDLRLSGPPSGQGTGGVARIRNRKVPTDLRADSLVTVPPTP